MQPNTLAPDYYNFMINAARVPADILRLNEKNVRGKPLSSQEAVDIIMKYRPTEHALDVAKSLPEYPPAVPCGIIHPWIDGCHATALERFLKVCQSMLPVYGTLHFVPMLLLRTRHLKKYVRLKQ